MRRTRKKNELRAAGDLPNEYVDSGDAIKYSSNKGTQTDFSKRNPTSAAATTSTPVTPSTPLIRRRSLSVGSSPLIASNAKKSLFEMSPIAQHSISSQPRDIEKPTPASAPVMDAEPATANVDAEKSKAVPAKAATANVDAEKSKKYPRALIDLCQEFARQDEVDRIQHFKNKKEGRYHLCPKRNMDSTDTSGTTMEHSWNYSCNSTCACFKDKQATSTSQNDSTYNTDNPDTTQKSSCIGLEDSVNTADEVASKRWDRTNIEASEPNAVRQVRGEEELNSMEAQQMLEDKESAGSSNTGKQDMSKKRPHFDDKDIEASQPKYFTQIRDEEVYSEAHRLYKHIRDVNNSRTDLDVTLLPKGAALVYSPNSKTIDVETSTDELEFMNMSAPPPTKKAAMDPKDFYKSNSQ